jgi:hypothetical protein
MAYGGADGLAVGVHDGTRLPWFVAAGRLGGQFCDSGGMESVDPGDPLSDAELRELMCLLARYAAHELDQWDSWKMQTSYGPVYMLMSRALPPGWRDEAFTTTWPLPAHLKEVPRAE